MYRCKHLKGNPTKRARRIYIQGWNAIVCEECHQTVKDTGDELNALFHMHKILSGERNVTFRGDR